jgi:hypothetical protein
MLAESTLILMYGRKLGTRLSNERCVHNIPGLMQGRALSSLQKAAQALDILTEVWDRIRPVTLLVRDHIRNLDPDTQSGTTQVSYTDLGSLQAAPRRNADIRLPTFLLIGFLPPIST